MRNNQRWNKAAIIRAIQHWHRLYGMPPRQCEWRPQVKPPWALSSDAVRYWFGSWNVAIKAAGFTPRRIGKPKVLREKALTPNGKFVTLYE